MSKTSRKQNFLQGTMLLALATAIVKVIGALYKIPLNAIIREQGFGYYSTAYEIYTLLLMISTAGLPVAMSRTISQAASNGNYRQVKTVYAVYRTVFVIIGLIGSLFMTLFCKQLAAFQEQPDAWAAIGALGPCCFLICLMSTYRGFFQGQSNMLPTSISQVIEAIVKLIVGIGAALFLMYRTAEVSWAAAGAILGVTTSCVVSSLYLGISCRKAMKNLPAGDDTPVSRWEVFKSLLLIALPMTVGSAGLQLLTVLETKIYMGRLLQTMPQAAADTQKGIYNMTQTIFNMPCAFITPITVSIIPAITNQLSSGNLKAAKGTEESAVRVTALISAPCAVGLAVLAEPVTALLGRYSDDNLALSTQLMTILGICVVFNAFVLLTNALMQAHGNAILPVVNMFVGGLIKLVAVSFLTGNPHIGILGAPIGSLLCYLSITVLNLVCIRIVLKNPPAILKNLLRSVLAALIMGVCTYGAWYGLRALLGPDMSRVIACGAPILVGVVVYAFLAVKLKAITKEDCLLLPKGEKIARLLHL